MSRESIINSIKKNKPEVIPLPEIDEAIFHEDIDLKETFKNWVALVGGTVIEADSKKVDSEIVKCYPNKKNIVSTTKKSSLGTIQIDKDIDTHQLENIDLAIVEGELGVSENGAIWVPTHSIVRALPFITNDLVIILNKNNICLHMLDAYDIIAKRDRNFGVFISGPSKTADIEQCLVVGAHGAMSLTVILV